MKMSITPQTIPENVYFNKNHLLSAAATRPLSSIMGGVGADNVSLADAQLVSRFISAGIQRHHPRLTHRHTHTAHTLNTALFPLRADSGALGSGAAPSQQSKVCSDGDQTGAAAASRWKRRRRQSSTEDRQGKTGKEATPSDWSQKLTDCLLFSESVVTAPRSTPKCISIQPHKRARST